VSWIITKYLITAALVVGISEIAKRSDKIGGLVAALPLVTVLTLIWLHLESQPTSKIANHAMYTFWYVLPTLPMFVVFPYLLMRIGFWWTMGASIALTIVCFYLVAWIASYVGVSLWP
jgi:hypothetical protein